MTDDPSLPLRRPDSSSSVPLHRQVEDDLRRLIASGILPPGSVLPPEFELCRAYGVGRQTVRLALLHLAADDLIARYAGRGTFVKDQPDRLAFYLDRSFTRQMAEMGLQAHSKVLDISTAFISETSPPPLRAHLGAPCLRLVRLRFGDADPVGIQATSILTDQCPGIETLDFDEVSLYEVLAAHYRLPIAEISHIISATTADELQAVLLQVAPGAPLLVVNTTALLATGDVIEHTISYYRADRYSYTTTHTHSPCT